MVDYEIARARPAVDFVRRHELNQRRVVVDALRLNSAVAELVLAPFERGRPVVLNKIRNDRLTGVRDRTTERVRIVIPVLVRDE